MKRASLGHEVREKTEDTSKKIIEGLQIGEGTGEN